MAVLDKDRPRGLRMPSLRAFSKQKSPDPIPAIQLPSPSQLSLQIDHIPVVSAIPLEKALPPHSLPSPPPQRTAPTAVINPLPSPLQVANPQDVPVRNPNPIQPIRNDDIPPLPSHAAPSAKQPMRQPMIQPTRRPVPGTAPALAPPVNPIAPQQRTPPSSEGEPEQRHSNDTTDSLEGFIPDPEAEPELDGTSSTPNEPVSSEEDDRPWTPPEVEPVVVPLNKLHYSCYQDHRAMPASNNVWYALPCMTCQKFDREIRHRCVFCCLRVCADCFQALKKFPRRSLEQLMESISANGVLESQPVTEP